MQQALPVEAGGRVDLLDTMSSRAIAEAQAQGQGLTLLIRRAEPTRGPPLERVSANP